MLKELEQRLEGDRRKLCALLGIHEQTYYKYKAGRKLPPYIVAHCKTLETLTDRQLMKRAGC